MQASVDQLVKEQQTVTIEAIRRKSIGLDPAGRGVKKSAILENEAAHAYYRKHSTSYQMAKNRNRKATHSRGSRGTSAQPLRIDPQRNADRARYRYLQMTKPEIVERLLQVEQAYAELAEQQARLQFSWAEREQQRDTNERASKKRTPVIRYGDKMPRWFSWEELQALHYHPITAVQAAFGLG